MTVQLTKQMFAIVPSIHLADIVLSHPEKKYTSGQKIKCRVLVCIPQVSLYAKYGMAWKLYRLPFPISLVLMKHDKMLVDILPQEKKLVLTCKKSMLKSTNPIITNYCDTEPGMILDGFIASVSEKGCLVAFYNDVKGKFHTDTVWKSNLNFIFILFYIESYVCLISLFLSICEWFF